MLNSTGALRAALAVVAAVVDAHLDRVVAVEVGEAYVRHLAQRPVHVLERALEDEPLALTLVRAAREAQPLG